MAGDMLYVHMHMCKMNVERPLGQQKLMGRFHTNFTTNAASRMSACQRYYHEGKYRRGSQPDDEAVKHGFDGIGYTHVGCFAHENSCSSCLR